MPAREFLFSLGGLIFITYYYLASDSFVLTMLKEPLLQGILS